MKNFKLNPQAEQIELTINVEIQRLESQGWDFSEYHENTAQALGIDEEDAAQRNYNEYSAVITIRGSRQNPETFVQWYSHNRNEYTEIEETGDDKQTIKDVLSMMEEGVLVIDENQDFSTDKNGNYTPTFIEIIHA